MIPQNVQLTYDKNDVLALATYLFNHPVKQKIWIISAAIEARGFQGVVRVVKDHINETAAKLLFAYENNPAHTQMSVGFGGMMTIATLSPPPVPGDGIVRGIRIELYIQPAIMFAGEYEKCGSEAVVTEFVDMHETVTYKDACHRKL